MEDIGLKRRRGSLGPPCEAREKVPLGAFFYGFQTFKSSGHLIRTFLLIFGPKGLKFARFGRFARVKILTKISSTQKTGEDHRFWSKIGEGTAFWEVEFGQK